ncbi:transcriptional pleiotropic regulator of transition state genes [Scopulibacillus darangshiensis]|uniref:Transcriptional pleiotropic regulator of transition state genes n=1 Tax=Scopulibacillus darangshiensis TaxID=442528 RepID=A0A4R2NSP0_9BACL|nr:AbrB/MazE/SpoVT family DNA-binding domain-containing protein [Scopulibacillus darangshiensis]TCP24484.1 transcriptional pleiotropic regulator of transition state genes [Scopulibacillus darangshiensis]
MKSTGIVRKVDELGRIVIPKELRTTMGIQEKDPLEIFLEDDRIVLKKYIPDMTCQITGETDTNNLILNNGNLVLSREGAEIVMDAINKKFEPVTN